VGELLPPRFILARSVCASGETQTAVGGFLSVALSGGRPPWALPSILLFGARTFLPGIAPAAIARLTHGAK